MAKLAGHIEHVALEYGGRTRTWIAHLPPQPAAHPALLIALHASMGTRERARAVFGYEFDLLADREGFIAVACSAVPIATSTPRTISERSFRQLPSVKMAASDQLDVHQHEMAAPPDGSGDGSGPRVVTEKSAGRIPVAERHDGLAVAAIDEREVESRIHHGDA